MMKRWTALFMTLVMLIGLITPAANVNAATTKVTDLSNGQKLTVTTLSKTYLYVDGKKIDMKNIPIFLKNGNYMGGVAKIFKNTTLNVKVDDFKEKGVPCLRLTYGKKVLIIRQGTNLATLNGVNVRLAVAPFRAYYEKSKATRWVVPISSVCNKLGIQYARTSDGIMKVNAPGVPMGVDKPDSDNNNSNNKKKIVITLDAGHGGSDSGALGNSLKEKNLTLAIVLAAKKYFDKNSRFQVYYTRTADKYPSLTDRSSLANSKSSDLFISVHINSYVKTSRGTETLYNANRLTSTKKNNITSKILAQSMQKAALEATKFPNRGLVNRTGLSVLNKTKMPACLIEYGFITNPSEAISMKNGTSRYGQALYNATVQLCKEKGLY